MNSVNFLRGKVTFTGRPSYNPENRRRSVSGKSKASQGTIISQRRGDADCTPRPRSAVEQDSRSVHCHVSPARETRAIWTSVMFGGRSKADRLQRLWQPGFDTCASSTFPVVTIRKQPGELNCQATEGNGDLPYGMDYGIRDVLQGTDTESTDLGIAVLSTDYNHFQEYSEYRDLNIHFNIEYIRWEAYQHSDKNRKRGHGKAKQKQNQETGTLGCQEVLPVDGTSVVAGSSASTCVADNSNNPRNNMLLTTLTLHSTESLNCLTESRHLVPRAQRPIDCLPRFFSFLRPARLVLPTLPRPSDAVAPRGRAHKLTWNSYFTFLHLFLLAGAAVRCTPPLFTRATRSARFCRDFRMIHALISLLLGLYRSITLKYTDYVQVEVTLQSGSCISNVRAIPHSA
ncbi:hypothetical protein J6590_001505 [Homalodisca vitripennis]|nr:hypothetical protein J6590_001505 [Homalodisca vitripennis]